RKNPGAPGPNGKLLGRLIDLAFNRIPQDPGNPAYRQGKTLGNARKAWFRAKTGNGRYRLFFRFQSKSKVIVYVWVNDEHTRRTYGGNTDAYAVFAGMLDDGNPPADWDALLEAAQEAKTRKRLKRLNPRPARGRG